MASSSATGHWQVKVISLHPSITKDSLAKSLCLDPSRMQMPSPAIAWIHGFKNKQDADEFVRQWSGLTISGVAIECCTAPPRNRNNASSQQQTSTHPKSKQHQQSHTASKF